MADYFASSSPNVGYIIINSLRGFHFAEDGLGSTKDITLRREVNVVVPTLRPAFNYQIGLI
jgi:hypothetical protein